MGLNTVPVAGDEFEIMDTLDGARNKAAEHTEVLRNSRLVAQAGEGKVTLHSFANAVAASQETGVERHQLNIVLKVDAQVIFSIHIKSFLPQIGVGICSISWTLKNTHDLLLFLSEFRSI